MLIIHFKLINLWSDYQQPIYNDSGAKIGSERGLDRDFFSLFSVFFPAVTGEFKFRHKYLLCIMDNGLSKLVRPLAKNQHCQKFK